MTKIITGVTAAIVLAVMAPAAMAQSVPMAAPDGDKPAVTTPNSVNPTAPVAGKNSFTEAQAKTRFEEAGYQNISNIRLNESGVWQASATKDAKPVTVVLDYQGNIVAK